MAGNNKGCFIALGIFGVFAFLVVGAIVYFGLKVKDAVVDNMQISEAVIEDFRQVQEENPFDPPEDNYVSAEQLDRFLSVKSALNKRVKESMRNLKAMDNENPEGLQEGFEQVGEVFKHLSGIQDDLVDALRTNHMSPQEYAFISGVVYKSYFDEVSENIPYFDEHNFDHIPSITLQLFDQYQEELENYNTGGLELGVLEMLRGLEMMQKF